MTNLSTYHHKTKPPVNMDELRSIAAGNKPGTKEKLVVFSISVEISTGMFFVKYETERNYKAGQHHAAKGIFISMEKVFDFANCNGFVLTNRQKEPIPFGRFKGCFGRSVYEVRNNEAIMNAYLNLGEAKI